jgi:hypothetical protein
LGWTPRNDLIVGAPAKNRTFFFALHRLLEIRRKVGAPGGGAPPKFARDGCGDVDEYRTSMPPVSRSSAMVVHLFPWCPHNPREETRG